MVDAVAKLRKMFPGGNWKVNGFQTGESKQAYVAENGQNKVFIKYDVKTPALHRLAELGVTPPIVYDGTKEERPYIIQEFVEAKYPDRKWFAENLQTLAFFIKKYQQDSQLIDLLSFGKHETYEESITKELTFIDESIRDSK